MPNIVSKTIMWLGWLFQVLCSVLMAHYLTKGIPKLNTFSRPFEIYAAGMFLLPILICGGFRFWLSRIGNPWLALVPFLIGTFFAWNAGLYGVFLLPEFCIVFQILSGILFVAYLPPFVRLRQTPKSEEPTTCAPATSPA